MKLHAAIACCVGLALNACGGGAAAPSSTGPSSMVLPAGAYALTIGPSSPPPPSMVLCLSIGTAPAFGFIRLRVIVTEDVDGWTTAMPAPTGPGGGTLQMQLRDAGAGTVKGTMGGSGSDPDGNMSVTVALSWAGGDATVSGAFSGGPNSLAGEVSGHVTLASRGASRSCSSNRWTLGPW